MHVPLQPVTIMIVSGIGGSYTAGQEKVSVMPLETRTLPGAICRERGGGLLAEGWCIIAYETGTKYEPLPEWRGEMIVADEDQRNALADAGTTPLYLQCRPYGGEFESWHGPVTVELVDSEADPYQRRVRLTSAGELIRGDRDIPGVETG